MGTSIQEKTQRLLVEIGRGNRAAAAELLPHVYDELRGLAAAYMRRRQAGQTLQPTALVHEAFLRLVDQSAAAAGAGSASRTCRRRRSRTWTSSRSTRR